MLHSLNVRRELKSQRAEVGNANEHTKANKEKINA